MALQLSTESRQETGIIHIEGRFTYDAIPGFKESVVEFLHEEHDKIVLDFEGVRYIDSSGIGGLIFLLNSAKKKGLELILCSLKPSVVNVFRQTRLDRHLHIEKNLNVVLEKCEG